MDDFDKRQASMKSVLTCGICKKLCKDVTIIEECCHRFCKNCIMRKVKEEKLKVCPECNTDLGVAPGRKSRPDHQMQGIRDMVSSKRREFIKRGLIEKSKKAEPKKLAREDIDLNKIPDMLIDTPPSPPHPLPPPPSPPPPIVATSSRRKEKSISSIEYVPSPKVKEHKVCKKNVKRLDVIQATEAPSRSNNNIDKGKGKKGQCGRKKKETNIPPPPVSGSGDGGSAGTNTNAEQVQVTTETTGGTSSDITMVVNERVHPIWFSLVACEKQEGHSPLPQISTRYIKIKDVNKPSSYIKKYLAHKLSLQSEDEVELRMLGMLIHPDLPIKDLEKLWLRVVPHSGKSSVKVGSSAEELVMVLKYSRSHPKLN
ncbi:E3 ubiquitin protein ligase DRIP1-like [Solanum verrucosum]|uniref:E3 ubiquitin protein ligase DRIP1-like n=1 Tax=Solanum verrucosum TaxID=315347 RepID=UPI0020D02466|nr:E3 ubiquitin protein ligase DRIP1-like [Solanum verrucosum]